MMRVLLTRPQAQSEKLGSVLLTHGIGWFAEPMLEIVPVAWDPSALAGRQAVLVTSANASEALLHCSEVRRDLPIFAVGPGTASPLLKAGFTNVHAAGGTAVDLIALVRRKLDPRAGRLLHLSGFDIVRDLAIALAPDGFAVDRVIAYQACAARQLSVRSRREISEARIDLALFFSARTAATFRELVSTSSLASACTRIAAIAFSARIADALRPVGFREVQVAAAPSLEAVLDAVLRMRGDARCDLEARAG